MVLILPKIPETSIPPFHFLTPVWGEEFVRFFLESSLPSLFSPNNLPSLPHPEQDLFHILTSKNDIDRIREHPSIAKLRSILPVKITEINERGPTTHDTMSLFLKNGIAKADHDEAASLFFNPDFIYCDFTVASLVGMAAQGKRVVFGIAPRVCKETAETTILTQHNANGVTTVSDRQLVGYALDYMHPIAHQHLWLEGNDPLIPANLYWRVSEQGVLAHCFHLHPFMVWPRRKDAVFSGTVDDDFVLYAAPDPCDRIVVQSSEKFFVVEVSTNSHQVFSPIEKGDIAGVVTWAEISASSLHRELIRTPINLLRDAKDARKWETSEDEAEQVVGEILDRLENPFSRVVLRQPLTALKRLVRLARERNMQSSNKIKTRSPVAELISEAFDSYSKFCAVYERFRDRAGAFIFGTDGDPKPTHARWLYNTHGLNELSRNLNSEPTRSILVLNNDEHIHDRLAALFSGAKIISPPPLRMAIGNSPKSAPERQLGSDYDQIIAIGISDFLVERPSLLDDLKSRLTADGQITSLPLFSSFDIELSHRVRDGKNLIDRQTLRGIRFMAKMDRILRKCHPSPVVLEIPFIPILWPLVAGVIALLNYVFILRRFGRKTDISGNE